MILVDTSVWIDHLRGSVEGLASWLETGQLAGHPMVIGELAMGSLAERSSVVEFLGGLPPAPVATHDEVAAFIEDRELFAKGLQLVDAHLLASVLLMPEGRLWTHDVRLRAQAQRLGVASAA